MSDRGDKTLIEHLEHELGVHAGRALGAEVQHYLTRLCETNDLNWIDLMVWRLTEEDVPLPTVIQNLAARAAYLRLHGANKRGGRPTKVWKEHAKAVALANSAFLQGLHTIGAEEADLRAVVSVESELGHAPKASSLSQERPSYTHASPVPVVLTSIGRAFQETYPELAAALADDTAKQAAASKKAKKEKKPNKVGTRR